VGRLTNHQSRDSYFHKLDPYTKGLSDELKRALTLIEEIEQITAASSSGIAVLAIREKLTAWHANEGHDNG